MAKDKSALGIITETGTFMSTDFPLGPELEHRVRTGALKVAERDADGEFRPADTILVVRERGELVPFNREVHGAQHAAEGHTIPAELVEDLNVAEEAEVQKAPKKSSKKGKKTDDGDLEDQGE